MKGSEILKWRQVFEEQVLKHLRVLARRRAVVRCKTTNGGDQCESEVPLMCRTVRVCDMNYSLSTTQRG